MNKLPIGEAIRFAYNFTFGQIGTIIGLIWIPMLIQVIGSYFVLKPFYTAAIAALTSNNIELLRQPMLMLLLFELVTLMLYAIMAVAIVQQALGLRQGPALAHFVLGTTELRVFGGFIGFILLTTLFFIVYLTVGSILVEAGLRLVPGISLKAAAVSETLGQFFFLSALVVLFYPLARLSYLIVPAALVEGGFGLARSWELTKGNFSRFFTVGLATVLPLLLLISVASGAVLEQYGAMAVQKTQMEQLLHMLNVDLATLPLMLGLGFVIAPLLLGLALAPAAFSYRALAKTID